MLRVTKLTDYATVVLTVLAARPQAVMSATELAEHSGLEAPTVSKLLKPLAQAGLVEGFRGATGGYRLARDAAAITECSLHDGHCGISEQCGVSGNWRRINDVVADALRAVTLAQMLDESSRPHSISTAGGAKRIDARLAST